MHTIKIILEVIAAVIGIGVVGLIAICVAMANSSENLFQ